MQIVLHIGVEKTGTSSIQRFLRKNRDALRRDSILYSEVAGKENHMALAAAAQDDQKRDDLRIIYDLQSSQQIHEFRSSLANNLVKEAEESGCSTMIFSGEHCSSRLTSHGEVEVLARILRKVASDIRIVVYLRRQDEFLCSTYSTDVKSGSSKHMALPPRDAREIRYNYHSLLQRWSSVFDRRNIVCRVYNSASLEKGDVVVDFANVIGLKFRPEFKKPNRLNESLDVVGLEFLRLFNMSVPRFKDGRLNPTRGDIVQAIQRISSGPSPTFAKQQLDEFMQYFRESNAKVAAEYFGALSPQGDPLFGEIKSQSNRAEMRPLSAEEAVQIAAGLWEYQQEHWDTPVKVAGPKSPVKVAAKQARAHTE
jgi:hypothetical protein